MSLEQAAAALPQTRRWIEAILRRVIPFLGDDSLDILELGAAQGRALIALDELGHRASGVEPWTDAVLVAQQLAQKRGAAISIEQGTAEAIPFPAESFDLVIATSVVEHVQDLDRTLEEVFRVLRPGGIFWFSAASARCPRQNEIRGFPAFGWYPDMVKQRIMRWAKESKPHLIGGTEHPAIHWFTPSKARRVLERAGFVEVWDRWDLRRPEDDEGIRRRLAEALKRRPLLRPIADVLVSGCSYAARKPA